MSGKKTTHLHQFHYTIPTDPIKILFKSYINYFNLCSGVYNTKYSTERLGKSPATHTIIIVRVRHCRSSAAPSGQDPLYGDGGRQPLYGGCSVPYGPRALLVRVSLAARLFFDEVLL